MRSALRRLGLVSLASAAVLGLGASPASAHHDGFGVVTTNTVTAVALDGDRTPFKVGYYTPTYVAGSKLPWGSARSQFINGRSVAAVYTKVSCGWGWKGYTCSERVSYVKLVRQ